MMFFDPTGRDWYTINKEGTIQLYKKKGNEPFDRLSIVDIGPPDFINSLRINDKSILKGRRNLIEIPSSVNKQDVLNIFFFISDAFIDREWGLYQNKSNYSLITSSNIDNVTSPLENVIWKIHSHSDTAPNDKAELESMGYWPYYDSDFKNGKLINKNAPWYVGSLIPNDLYNLKNTGIPSRVYFPLSGHVYRLNQNSLPSLIETRKRK